MSTKECSRCLKTLDISCFSMNKKNGKEYIYSRCKKCKCEVMKEHREQNIDSYKEKDKAFYEKNKESRVAKTTERYKKRLENDTEFALRHNVRSRINQVFKRLDKVKVDSTIELLGCSYSQLKKWIEFQMADGFTWENYGKLWHIDHMIPVSAFEIENIEKQKQCFNWSNLRPLLASTNLHKHNRINLPECIDHIELTHNYIMNNSGYQITSERVWWLGIEPRYGKNPKDDKEFQNTLENLLKSTIRSQAFKLIINV